MAPVAREHCVPKGTQSRQEHDPRQGENPNPCTRCRQQLCITQAQPFLPTAAEIDRSDQPEYHIANDSAPDRLRREGTLREGIRCQSDPYQRKRIAIRQAVLAQINTNKLTQNRNQNDRG